ncbi:MAG: MFS transporter [Phycisphaerae bacterium]|nr:MFS transporter [Phycisphaerae bacterium]
MTRFLIYLFPAMFDMVLTCVLLTGEMRMAAMNAPATATTGVPATWAITYILACLVIGRWIHPAGAARYIVAGGIVAACGAAGFLVFPHLYLVYLFTAVVSVGGALFFVPFQVFMKAVDQEHESPNVVRATALYTLSWSGGFAAGLLAAGIFWNATGTWEYGYVFSGIMALAVSLGVLGLRYGSRKGPSARQVEVSSLGPKPAVPDRRYENFPDFAWLGWVGSGAGIFCFYLILGMFPVTGNHFDLSKDQQGMVIALMAATQALTGLLLGFGRFWMYRRALVGIFGLCGIAGLVLYALGESVVLFYPAAVCFGLYSGSFFFYLVFHAIIHPHRAARYVSVNETIVGVCGFVGPMAGGLLADGLGLSCPYWIAIGILTGGVVLKLVIHTRHRPKLHKLKKP